MVCKNRGVYGFLGPAWVLITMALRKQGVCGEFGWVRFLVVCFLYKTNPNPNTCCREKSGPNSTLNLFFLGLGWPWVGEFVGVIIIFICFPTQHILVYRKRPYYSSVYTNIHTTRTRDNVLRHQLRLVQNHFGHVIISVRREKGQNWPKSAKKKEAEQSQKGANFDPNLCRKYKPVFLFCPLISFYFKLAFQRCRLCHRRQRRCEGGTTCTPYSYMALPISTEKVHPPVNRVPGTSHGLRLYNKEYRHGPLCHPRSDLGEGKCPNQTTTTAIQQYSNTVGTSS